MNKKIMSFERFIYESTNPDNVRIFSRGQYEECKQHIEFLEEEHGVEINCWTFMYDEDSWDNYTTFGKMLAVIETENTDPHKKLIAARLKRDGTVEEAYYNDDIKKCPLSIAQDYILSMELITKENKDWEYEEGQKCNKCGCDCDECECNECDCSGDWKNKEEMSLEYYDFEYNLSEDLLSAIDAENLKEVEALLEAGADVSYKRYLSVKRAATKTNTRILEALLSEIDEIEKNQAREIVDVCEKQNVSSRNLMILKRGIENILEEQIFEKKGTSYKKSGLKNPKKADLDKDKKISPYEKARGKAIQKSVQSEKEEKGKKGLTAAQKKLPEALRKAIEKRMKK